MNQQTRFKATFQGAVLGWFDSADEAQAAIDAAKAEEINEEKALEAELFGPLGCPGSR